MSRENEALWLDSRTAPLRVGPAPYHRPGAGEVVVRTAAVAVNPVDTMSPIQRRVVYPWLRYPAVLGLDVAGEVVEAGPGVGHLRVGNRVVGLATGQERHRNDPAGGAFQRYVVLTAATTSPLPEHLGCTEAVVLPLGAATATAGLFSDDHLALSLPGRQRLDDGRTVLVWGGSTSVGSNAIQLARHAGYRVLTTASPRNHGFVLDIGAAEAFDYRRPPVTAEVTRALEDHRLAGVLAIGGRSLSRAVRVAGGQVPSVGEVRVASAHPGPATTARSILARPRGVRVSAVWGGSVTRNDLGPALYMRVLPAAMAAGTYHPVPPAEVVGDGLGLIPVALARLRDGVSARKLVVTVSS